MKVVYTPTGGVPATLVDDSVKLYGTLGDWGLEGLEAVEDMFQSATALRYMLGNLKGAFIVEAACSCVDYATAAAYMKQELNRGGTQGTLVLTVFGQTFTMASATCKAVHKTKWSGVLIGIRYTFGITTIA